MPYIDKPLAKMRVLAADDNDVNRLFLDGILKPKVQQLKIVKDGSEAILAGKEQHWDLILLDLHMPGADGIDVMQALTTNPISDTLEQQDDDDKVLFIVITADARKSEQDRLLGLGFHGFLTKPISGTELVSGLTVINDHPGQPVTIAHARQVTHTVLDDYAALEVLHHDRGLLAKMREQFVLELIPTLDVVTGALHIQQDQPDDNESRRTIWTAVHKMAGGCAYTGATKLAEVCTHIQEQVDKEVSLEALMLDYQQLHQVVQQTAVAIQSE